MASVRAWVVFARVRHEALVCVLSAEGLVQNVGQLQELKAAPSHRSGERVHHAGRVALVLDLLSHNAAVVAKSGLDLDRWKVTVQARVRRPDVPERLAPAGRVQRAV